MHLLLQDLQAILVKQGRFETFWSEHAMKTAYKATASRME